MSPGHCRRKLLRWAFSCGLFPWSYTMSFYDLIDLGWSSFFSTPFDSLNLSGLAPARVARAERERYLLMHAGGYARAVLAGRLRHESLGPGGLPVVGDWIVARLEDLPHNGCVEADTHSEAQFGAARIEAILPRRTLLSRLDPSGGAQQPLAANVDLVLLAAGLDHDFNPRRLERGAALAREAGAEPVVVLTKADLRPDCRRELSQVMSAVPGAYALALSARTGQGVDELRGLLTPGVTAVLLGSSGAGKSTLVNRLLGSQQQRTAAVREADSRGRHATTHRELFPLPGGGLLIDTPGLRAFGLTGEDGVGDLFADVERFAASCRFRDCRHEAEPGCGVKQAMDRGELTPERYASFLKLRSEAERIERRQASPTDLEAKRKDKELGKLLKRYARINPKS
ncbi:ribosome small subunit-dependent GTPase A [Oceanidesulfovibrio marinus]|uniref:Small ribosomal subunit biogenesis GTPase RsgA n=2 Tax=Oceanidesulfovibrio marinus TaxID=370038 RepID=A0A6P1ZH85_9BACT|nr:ribosome small subunit-dependent GTPase A [Oceanidesulfovibrio marinus]